MLCELALSRAHFFLTVSLDAVCLSCLGLRRQSTVAAALGLLSFWTRPFYLLHPLLPLLFQLSEGCLLPEWRGGGRVSERGSPGPRLQSPLPLQAMGPLPGKGTGQGPMRAGQAPFLTGPAQSSRVLERPSRLPLNCCRSPAEAGVWSLTCVEPFSAAGKEAGPLLSSAALCCKGQEIPGVSLLTVTAFGL